MKLNVLLVEDDFDLAALICEYLSHHGIQVEHAIDGTEGLQAAKEHNYDVLLLDLMLPKLDGLTLCRSLRSEGIETPIIMISAQDALHRKIAGFEAGADDYLTKPFALEELFVRIQSLAKWHSGQIRKLQIEDLSFDMNTQIAKRGETLLKLSPSCCRILEALMRASPSVVTKQQLEQMLWTEELPDSDVLKVHLYHLRQQVDKPFSTPLIQTVPGKGFALKAE